MGRQHRCGLSVLPDRRFDRDIAGMEYHLVMVWEREQREELYQCGIAVYAQAVEPVHEHSHQLVMEVNHVIEVALSQSRVAAD